MGSLTLKEIRDLVILDCGIQANPQFPPVRVNKEINLAQRYVQMQLNGLGMKHWEDYYQPSTLGFYTLGGQEIRGFKVSEQLTNMLEMPHAIKFITCYGPNGTDKGQAFEVDDRHFVKQILNTYSAPTVKEPIFCRIGDQVFIAPSSVQMIIIYYYKRIANLTTDIAISDMPDEFEDFILARAEFQINRKLGLIKDAALEAKAIDDAITETYKKYLSMMRQANMNDVIRDKAE